MVYLCRDDLKENIAIIKINNSYTASMTSAELYDCTRGCWKRKLDSMQKVEYVLSVAKGIVVEVYNVDKWLSADKLNRETIPYDAVIENGRIGFSGAVADEEIRNRYIGKSVANLFKRGDANPVKVFLKQ